MFHFTLTGSSAGRPFCDVDKERAREDGDSFQHVAYSKTGETRQLNAPNLCPTCKSL